MTMAQECETRFRRQLRTRQFLDYLEFDSYLNKFGTWGECRRSSGRLDLNSGKGFEVEIHFADDSLWLTSAFYFETDGQIAFEKRGDIPA